MHGRYIIRFNITIPNISDSKNDYLKYNCQELNSSCEKICVGNDRLFFFNHDDKLGIYYILKRRFPVIKINSLVILIECTEMDLKHKDENGLCVSKFLNNMGWYLDVIGKLHNRAFLIYIFTGKVQNCTTSIFNKTLYRC